MPLGGATTVYRMMTWPSQVLDHSSDTVMIAELWRPEVARRWKILAKFLRLKNNLLRWYFQKFCSECFHRLIDWRVVFKFCEIWPTGNRWNRALFAWQKKNKVSPGSPAVATAQIPPKICQGQPPTMYSECSRFQPPRFTFGGVIAERVNTAKPRRKVNPIPG